MEMTLRRLDCVNVVWRWKVLNTGSYLDTGCIFSSKLWWHISLIPILLWLGKIMGSRRARTLSQGERNVFLNVCGREGSGVRAGVTLETDSVELVFSCFTWVPGQACAGKAFTIWTILLAHIIFSFLLC